MHVTDLLVRVQSDAPSVFRPHSSSVQAVALYLSFSFLDLSEVGGAFWSYCEFDLRAQIYDGAFALLRNCNYRLSGCFLISFKVALSDKELSILRLLRQAWKGFSLADGACLGINLDN